MVRKAGMWALAAAVWASAPLPIQAQDQVRLTIVQPGHDGLDADLIDLVKQALTPALQKQAGTLQDVLDEFEVGVDGAKPIVVDLVFTKTGIEYQGAIPYLPPIDNKRQGLFANLSGFGFKISSVKNDPTLHEVRDPSLPKPFYLRDLTGPQYAIMANDPASIPNTLPNPQSRVAAWLGNGRDIVVHLEQKPEGADARKAAMSAAREQLESVLKFNRDESKEDFAFRKATATLNLAEMERFLLDAQKFTAAWTTDVPAGKGHGELELIAFPGSSLANSIELAASKPSYFANIALKPDAVFYGRMRFPLDSFRKEQLKLYYPTLRPVLKSQIDTRERLTADGKVAAKQAADLFVDLFEAGLADDAVDSFVQIETAKNGHSMIGGIRVADGAKAPEILKLLPKIQSEWKVKLDAEKHGEVTIHQVTLPERWHDEFKTMFGGEPVLYVGTSKDAVWGAAGDGSLELLKAAIDAAAKPAPEKVDPKFVEAGGQFGPGARLIDKMVTKQHSDNPTKDKKILAQRKERERIIKLAVDSFKDGTDRSTMELSREGDTIRGSATINPPVFRFLGSAIADFAKENLN